ncbi:WRKY transcription factor [Asimina triloba]
MGEVREENKRLKMKLAGIVKDYQSLQIQFFNNLQEEQGKKPTNETSVPQETKRERDLISLSLGTSSTGKKKEEKMTACSDEDEEDAQLKETLSLKLLYSSSRRLEDEADCGGPIKVASTNLSSPQNSSEGGKKEESGEAWAQQPAASRSRQQAAVENGDEEVSHQPAAKKARVSVRARCDTPTVQRCAADMSILITTYEGTHNHPLPVSATAMASTTSAAASMLMSGSSTSQTTTHQETFFPVATTNANFLGLNLSFSDNSRPKQFYQSNPSTLLQPSTSHPTITLDLTSIPPRFNTFSSNLTSSINPRYPSTGGFSFSSSAESTTLPTSWSSCSLSGTGTHAYKQNPTVPSLLGRPSHDHLYFPKSDSSPHHQQLLTESSVAEATKAILSDPNFRPALIAAITSTVSSAQGNQQGGGRENFKWGEIFPTKSAIARENGCAPTYFK